MGVQLPRSPVRLSRSSLFGFFVSLSGSLCSVVRLSLFCCSVPSLSCSAFFVSLFGFLDPLCPASLLRCSSLSLLCPTLFVPLSGSLAPLCTASLFRCPTLLLFCPTPSLDWSCSLSFARVPCIYYLFFYMGDKSGRVASLISWRKPFPHPTPFFGFNTSCFWR